MVFSTCKVSDVFFTELVRFQCNLRLPGENAGLEVWYGTRGGDSCVSVTGLSSLSVSRYTLKIFQN